MKKTKKTVGRKPLPSVDHRTCKVDVRLSAAELATLDESRGTTPRARYLRESCLRGVQIGGIDRNMFSALARVGNNINQIARALNTDRNIDIQLLGKKYEELKTVLDEIIVK